MMWLVRAGRDGIYYDSILELQRIFLPWNGYHYDFTSYNTKEELRAVVGSEKKTDNRTSIATWVGQINDFVREIKIGDYVLTPSKGSHTYVLSVITGDYEYNPNQSECLQHSHSIKVILKDFPRDVLSKQIQYSLGAYKTIFRVKYENEIISSMEKWKQKVK